MSSAAEHAARPPESSLTVLHYEAVFPGVTPEAAYACFLSYLWKKGADFGPTPEVTEEGDPVTGLGCLRTVQPIGLQEKVLEVEWPRRVRYRVMNPGLTTYQVSFHEGVVEFKKAEEGGVRVDWDISLVPLWGWGLVVRLVTNLVLTTYMKNFTRAMAAEEAAANGAK